MSRTVESEAEIQPQAFEALQRCDEHRKALFERLQEVMAQRDEASRQIWRLLLHLQQAREQVQALREEVEKLSAPPSTYGIFSSLNEDRTANIYVAGRKMKVNLHPAIEPERLRKGQELILNEALNVVEAAGFEGQGEVVKLKELLDPGRAIVSLRADEERVAELGEPLQAERLQPGDLLLFDPRSGLLLEKLPKGEVEELLLEEVPQVTYDDVGGLELQIEMIKDAIELPYLCQDYFREHKLKPPKGVLLYGPPGCGKTLIAKAVANSLAKQVSERTGKEAKSYFLNVKGPELLNKYVGETERKIREIFQRAREKASEGHPVVIFFDEMDSLFRTRGSGISSDVESTIVPQFLAELDGVEGLSNVIVIGASNRQDLIDPAVLRPGRFDVKIKIDRPNKEAAKDIFAKYLTPDLPLAEGELKRFHGDRQALVQHLIDLAAEEMYRTSDDHRFLEVTYQSGEKETLYFKDFISGAMIASICTRAKKAAVKRVIQKGEKGITVQDLLQAVKEEFKENEDLPNTTNPDDWNKIAGRRGRRIVQVSQASKAPEPERKIEAVAIGHYL